MALSTGSALTRVPDSFGQLAARGTEMKLRRYLDGLEPPSQIQVSLLLGRINGFLTVALEDNEIAHRNTLNALSNGVSLRAVDMSEEERSAVAEISDMVRETIQNLLDNSDDAAGPIIDDLRDVERAFLQPPRIAIIADRAPQNIINIAYRAGQPRPKIDLAGIIVPGYELDDEIIGILDLIPDVRKKGRATTGSDDEPTDLHVDSPYRHIDYAHVPYEAARLKKEPDYRKNYCLQLLNRLQGMKPDWILLDNFKIILDEVITKEFPGHVVNIHPSILPLNKGWRTEQMADPHLGNINPEALGYTIHLVSEDLDGGPTLFQQRVDPDPFDEEEIAEFGTREMYDKYREEVIRLKVIEAESKYSASVMEIVTSDRPRVIVRDEEAFNAEGRPGFELTPAYTRSLELDHEEWQKRNNAEIPFEQWKQNDRKPYERVLFKEGDEYKTLEAILKAEPIAPEQTHAPLSRYNFKLRGGADHKALYDKYMKILGAIEKTGKFKHQVVFASQDVDGKPCLVCSIFTTSKVNQILQPFGVDFTVRTMAVGVTAQRKPKYEY